MNLLLDKTRIKSCIGSERKRKATMNRLPLEKQTQIVGLLVEGMSLKAITRLADVSINAVTKLLVDLGMACAKYHDEHVRAL